MRRFGSGIAGRSSRRSKQELARLVEAADLGLSLSPQTRQVALLKRAAKIAEEAETQRHYLL